MKFLWYATFSLVFIILPLLVFTHHLDSNPPGFFIDESIYGYEAYSLYKTHGFSSNGEFLPRLFLNPGEEIRSHGLYTYLMLPFVAFGMNEFSVRFTSVIMSIATICLLYILLRKKVSKLSLLFIGIFWTFTSWVFLLSRIGMEFMAGAFFFLLTIYLLDKINQKKIITNRMILLLGIVLFILFGIYAAGKVWATLFMFLGLFILWKKNIDLKKTFLFLSLCILTFALSLTYILDKSFFYKPDDLSRCQTPISQCFTKNILTHFKYDSYFSDKWIPPDYPMYSHNIINSSLIPLFLFPFLLIGIFLFLKKAIKKDSFALLVIISSTFPIIAASLTIRGFDSFRSVALLPILFIFIAYGFDFILKSLQQYIFTTKNNFKIAMIPIIIITTLIAHNNANALFNYEYQTAAAVLSGWHYGTRAIFDYFDAHTNYDEYVITPSVAYLAEKHVRFYNYDERYKNLIIGYRQYDRNKKILYALRPDERDKGFYINKTIYYPNKHDIAFYIGEYK